MARPGKGGGGMMQGFSRSLRPETELLFACTGGSLDAERLQRAGELLQCPLDWPSIIEKAQAHGVLSLLYRNLRNHFSGSVPASLLEKMKNRYFLQAARNLRMTRHFHRLLDCFEENQIPVIPYKGPALAVSVYGDLSLRSFVDLDFLVREKDLPRAKSLLYSQGYKWHFSLSRSREDSFLQSDEGCLMSHEQNGAVVEVDATIAPREFPVPLGVETFWDGTERTFFEGRPILSFKPEDLFLILCVHGSKHGWERLIWLCDLAELARQSKGMDLEKVMAQARKLGCERMVSLGLRLISGLFSSPLPPEILQRTMTSEVDSLVDGVLGRFEEGRFFPCQGFALTWYYLSLCERRRDRAGFFLRLAFVPSVLDWEFFPLPRILSPLYYLIHPLRLIGKYAFLPAQPRVSSPR
jgi:hypothetical protein